jgi:hypothetical protein
MAWLVSLLVSFAYVRHRSVRTTENEQPRSRTLLTSAGHRPTDLESVLASQCRRSSCSRLPSSYSSEIQQPRRTTAAMGGRRHTYWAGPFVRHLARAHSLHPEGTSWPAASRSWATEATPLVSELRAAACDVRSDLAQTATVGAVNPFWWLRAWPGPPKAGGRERFDGSVAADLLCKRGRAGLVGQPRPDRGSRNLTNVICALTIASTDRPTALR